MQNDVLEKRRAVISGLFPEGIPTLWCPMIVQYTPLGQIDLDRMEKHMRYMIPDVRSFLLFGSTGDGWELDSSEKETLLRACAKWARLYGIRMLLGVLKPGIGESGREIDEWMKWLKAYAGTENALEAMRACGVVGFTVCAPKGETLSQQIILDELESILDISLPVAIYQLPQVTQNEIAPETLSKLALRYPNFYLFKDTSGTDRVLLSGLDFGGVFFVRGMEGNYYKWFTRPEGRYPGFLLSSANCFASLLKRMLQAAGVANISLAKECSDQVQGMIDAVFTNVGGLSGGNAFANANKCFDHCLAYGNAWAEAPMPMRHCGETIPAVHVAFAAKTLKSFGFMPEKGYLQEV